jgi:hypothetical protein
MMFLWTCAVLATAFLFYDHRMRKKFEREWEDKIKQAKQESQNSECEACSDQ